jgi:S1-C subfamily serine protease
MFSRLLILCLGLAVNAAQASEPAARPTPAAGDAADRAESQAHAAASAVQAERELAEVRQQISVLSRRMAELSLQLGDVGPQAYAFRYLNDSDRAMIGVVLSPEPKGARIDAVTPDGPAARAGLHSGDLLVSINGEELVADSAEVSLERARKLLGDLKPGERVRLGYRRGGRDTAVVEVKAERREAWNWQRLFVDRGDDETGNADDGGGKGAPERETRIIVRSDAGDREQRSQRTREAMVEARRAMREARTEIERSQRGDLHAGTGHGNFEFDGMSGMMPWWGIDLATLNADLGRYFGTDSGVLVLSSSKNALKELRAGDVILRVGDQAVERPEQALRALRDQEVGKNVELSVLRERKKISLAVRVPEYKAIFDIRPIPAPPAPPAPPAAPAPPAPEAPGVPAAPATVPEPPAPLPPPPPVADTDPVIH